MKTSSIDMIQFINFLKESNITINWDVVSQETVKSFLGGWNKVYIKNQKQVKSFCGDGKTYCNNCIFSSKHNSCALLCETLQLQKLLTIYIDNYGADRFANMLLRIKGCDIN